MKKIILAITVIALGQFKIAAQTSNPSQNPAPVKQDTSASYKIQDDIDKYKNFWDDYGIGIKVQNEKLPKDNIGGGHPENFRADLSVKIKKDGRILQEACTNYFTVNYTVTAKNTNGEKAARFAIVVADSFATATTHQVVNAPVISWVVVNPNDSVIIRGSFRVNYPYVASQTKGSPVEYISKDLGVYATIMGGSAFPPPHNGVILVLDTRKENNKDAMQLDTPLPNPCNTINGSQAIR